MGRNQISFASLLLQLFFRIALNWGKQPVVNLPSDRLLRRGVQVRREYRLISTVFFSFAEVIPCFGSSDSA